jgi:response regulator RpfG family c-di-GMP phosphodiesterase
MSSNRSYRPAVTRERVLDEIRQCAGTQFDPQLVAMFMAMDFVEIDQILARHTHRLAA